MERKQPGVVREALMEFLRKKREAHVQEIHTAVEARIGDKVSPSSVRSYLNLNTNKGQRIFQRTGRGRYRLIAG